MIVLMFSFSTSVFAIDEIELADQEIPITEGATLSLDDCIELAIKNSPEIEIYKQQVEVQDSRVGQSKASYFPTVP